MNKQNGTFMLSPADAENSVREALKMGYRLIDTANAWDFELTDDEMAQMTAMERDERFADY